MNPSQENVVHDERFADIVVVFLYYSLGKPDVWKEHKTEEYTRVKYKPSDACPLIDIFVKGNRDNYAVQVWIFAGDGTELAEFCSVTDALAHLRSLS